MGKEALGNKLNGTIVKRDLCAEEDREYCAEVSHANRNETGLPMLA